LSGADPELNKLILSILPLDWDDRFTSKYISDRVPGLGSRGVAAYIKRNLEYRYVESRKVQYNHTWIKVYRINPEAYLELIVDGKI
jgi:hypothetical protein